MEMRLFNTVNIVLLVLCMISLASAANPYYGYFKYGENFTFEQTCTYDGNSCDSCTIQFVKGNRGEILDISSSMNSVGNGRFNISIPADSLLYKNSQYDIHGFCEYDLEQYDEHFVTSFKLTIDGEELSNSKIYINFIVLLFIVLSFMGLSYMYFKMPESKYADNFNIVLNARMKNSPPEYFKALILSQSRTIIAGSLFLLFFMFSFIGYGLVEQFDYEIALVFFNILSYISLFLILPIIAYMLFIIGYNMVRLTYATYETLQYGGGMMYGK